MIFVACFINLVTFADSAYPDSLCVVQPNGDTLWTYLCGDEFYHWRSTIDGHVIMRDTNNYFRYAVVEADSLQTSAMIAHNIEERSIAEQEFVNTNGMLVEQFIDSAIQEIDRTIESKEASMLPPRQRVREAVVGTRKILTILIDFKDYSFTRSQVEFDNLMNQPDGRVGRNQGSVRQYYRENSYGQLDVVSTVVGPYRANWKRERYSWKNTGKWYDGMADIRILVREAINHAKDQVDFSTLDGDGDGYVDCVHVVFAGEGLSSGSTDSYIWPHNSRLLTAISQNGVKAKTYMITPELLWFNQLASIGTICHELGHILGAPDYYDARHNNGKDCFNAIGEYDLMSGGDWNNAGYTPAHHNPYTKCYIFGWDTPKTISSKTKEHTLSSATNGAGNIYRIDTQTEDEFFLLEHRSSHGFDQHIPNWGLLIYHAHKDLGTIIDNDENINDIHPLKLYLVDASASTNPTSAYSSYGKLDSQRAFPGIENDKTMFTSTTIPCAKAWDNSAIGVNLYFINQTSNNEITFTVNPEIQGPSQLCGIQDYCVSNHVPYTNTIEWSYSTDIAETSQHPALRFLDGTEGGCIAIERGNTPNITAVPIEPGDTTIVMTSYGLNNTNLFPEIEFPEIQLARDPYVGTATLYATIKGGDGTYQLEKEIVLPEYVTPSLAPSYTLWPINTERTLSDTSCINIEPEHIKWYVRYPNSMAENVYTGHDVTLRPTEAGEMTVRIVNDCGCEASNKATYTYTVVNTGPMSYPNPVTTSILPIDIMRYDDSTLYTVELWHQTYGRKDSQSTTGDRVEFDVSGLPTDWYQLVLHRSGQILDSGSVYIQH